MKIYEVYKNFFYGLDYIYDSFMSKELGNYLSGANPFLFNDEGSADPYIYWEFKKQFINDNKCENISGKEAYNWLVKYVNNINNDAVKRAFEKISCEMWLESLK